MWSYLLAGVGIAGLLIAPHRPRTGWAVNIAAQTLWAVYAVATGQPGFLLSAAVYAVAYVRLLRRATPQPAPAATTDAPPPARPRVSR